MGSPLIGQLGIVPTLVVQEGSRLTYSHIYILHEVQVARTLGQTGEIWTDSHMRQHSPIACSSIIAGVSVSSMNTFLYSKFLIF